MASLYKEALKNAQKQQDEFRKYVEKSAAKQSKKKTEPRPIPRNQNTSKIPARSKEKHKASSGRHRVDADTRQILNKEVQTNPIPQAITRFNEKVVNDIALAPVTIPYQIATGKKLIDFGLEPETESAKVGAGVGNFLGTATSYASGYKAAGKAISKGAEKLLASEAGKKATAKVVGSALGKKAGQEAAENVVGGIARNIVGDATVGTLLNLSDARGRGLEGEELAKDMALNAAIDFGVGNALEFLPMAAKAIKNVKTEPRIVNGKVKYVKVNNTANQTAGENLPFADSVARDIPFADSANVTAPDIMTPETQQKIFSAVEKRSGAKIVHADLPEGVDGKYENGVITISNTAKNPAYTVLKHELTHHIETSGNYQALSDFIERNMKEAGYDVEGAINQIQADYKRAGKELSPEQAKKEFIAKFSEEYLFNSEKSIERLARENPNVFRQIYDWIVDTVRKIGATDETKFLIDAQRKYEKALRTVGDAQARETQMSFIGKKQDGIEEYKTSDNIKNMPLPEKKQFFKNKLENEYNGRTIKFQKDGRAYYASFDGVDVDKIIYGDNKSDGSGYKAKINAGADGDFFDLIEHSNYDKTLPEKGKGGRAHKGVKTWDYYTKTVEIDGNLYDEVINVRDKGNGQYVYSVTLEKHKKIEPSSKALAYNGKKPNGYAESGGLTLIEILPRNDPGVNAKKAIPLESRVSGDALLDAQDTIEVVKSIGGNIDENGYVTLYHRTSKENADKIKKSGKMSAKEDGIFFSTQKSGYNDGYGDSVIELKIPAEKLVLDDIFDNEAHFRIPLKNKDTALDVSDYLGNDA